MTKRRKQICVVTGSRSDYGLLYPLMRRIKADKSFTLQVVATCMHLSHEFGLTFRQIERDGFTIDEKIEMLLSSDTPVSIAKSLGLGCIGIADALRRLRPDLLLVLGDRFEIYAAATVGHLMGIPVGHLHGGELTEGAVDDAFRHSVTKMSYLHFTSTSEYRKRVIQLGETPARVFNVGAIGLDNIRLMRLRTKADLEKDCGIRFGRRNLLVTFHPVTLEKNSSRRQFANILKVIGKLEDSFIIFTKTNADMYGRIINDMIDTYVVHHSDTSIAFASMGQVNYLSTMKHVDGVVGNSSSGIIEAPSFKIGTLNIGDRQRGRVRAASVIDSEPTVKGISAGIEKLFSASFKRTCRGTVNPYGDGRTSERIVAILKKVPLSGTKKTFHDT